MLAPCMEVYLHTRNANKALEIHKLVCGERHKQIDELALQTFRSVTTAYGGFPAIDTCTKCGNWRARGMACGFCDRTGQAPCPATAPHTNCNLCKGEGYVEELKS